MTTQPLALGSHAFFFPAGTTVASSVGSASRSLTSNVATIVTAHAHGLWTGAVVTLSGFTNTTFNVSNKTVTVVDATSFTVPITASNVSSGADTGGTITLAGTAAKALRPMNPDRDSGWREIGIIEKSSIAKTIEKEAIYAPSPGRLRKVDVIGTKCDKMLKFTSKEVSPLHVQMILDTAALDGSSTQFNQDEGPVLLQGWLQVQRYNGRDDGLFITELVWVSLSVPSETTFDGKPVTVEFEAELLYNRLNTGTLA